MGYYSAANAAYLNVFDAGTLTIASGVVTLPVIPVGTDRILANIDTEAAAGSDILDSIATTGPVAEGTVLIISSVSDARNIVVNSDAVATIMLNGNVDATLDDADDNIFLIRNNAGGWSGFLTNAAAGLPAYPLYARVDAATALAGDTSEQPMFAAANDALTVLAATTYRFRCIAQLTTGATSASVSFSLNGDATFTSSFAVSQGTNAASGTAAAPVMNNSVALGTAFVVCAAGTGVNKRFIVEGEFEVNAGGTIIPSVTFSADPQGTETVDVGSFFEAWSLGGAPVTSIGSWS